MEPERLESDLSAADCAGMTAGADCICAARALSRFSVSERADSAGESSVSSPRPCQPSRSELTERRPAWRLACRAN